MKKKRKRKPKLSNYLMVVLLLLIFYYLFTQMSSIAISAEKLARNYSNDVQSADERYLNKEIELSGKVKAYFEFENDDDLLEIISENALISVFCIIMSEEQIKKAKSLTQGTEVKIKGKCLGLAENKFPNSVYIQIHKIN
jgi:hypothetical protein